LAPIVLRPGAITKEMIEQTLNQKPENLKSESGIKASGLLNSHYAPKAKIVINSTPKSGEGFYALNEIECARDVIRVGKPETIEEFARNLYGAFRKADSLNLRVLNVVIPVGNGIIEAIADRVNKASVRA
jgi:L-threonylcarbamoyladenylate synthase